MQRRQPQGLELFFSYAHEDEDLCVRLGQHLDSLKRAGVIAAWHDREIRAGQRWEELVQSHLASADLILLLVSPTFFSSEYCFETEMRWALERHDAGTAVAIPILLRPCVWKHAPFAELQILPRNGIAVSKWRNRDEALAEVAAEIADTIELHWGSDGRRRAGEAVRKPVTIVSASVDFAAHDRPRDLEARRRMSDAFDITELGAILERHGGTVEMASSGELRACFGRPTVHEDDALRAVRAGLELRRAAEARNEHFGPEWQMAARIGIDTGEMLDDPDDGRFASAEPVDGADRLRVAAGPAEILIGSATHLLVRRNVDAERRELAAGTGPEPAVAFAVQKLRSALRDSLAADAIGRASEQAMIAGAFEHVVVRGVCHVVTVLGEPGIGKWRLAKAAMAALPAEAIVLTTHCEPYRERALDPALEIARQIVGLATGADSATIGVAVNDLVGDEPDAPAIATSVEELYGVAPPAASVDRIFWALPKLAEALARRGPVVLVFDDLHWAEPKLLDLIEHMALRSRQVPIMLFCLARPDLLDKRADWGAAKLNATSIWLGRLSVGETESLVDELASDIELSRALRRRIVETSEGNALFVKEMLAMAAEEGHLDEVPPTIEALLAARIDQLPVADRQLIQRAAVIGNQFPAAAVAALLDRDPAALRLSLDALTQRGLIQPERSPIAGHELYGFSHRLVCDAAYAASPKEVRADLHERLAAWLEHDAAAAGADDEEVGYHLEQAAGYLRELGPDDASTAALAQRAAARLAAAGRRGLASGDVRAAASLLDRAVALLATHDPARLEFLPDLARALRETGDFRRALTIAESGVEDGSPGTRERLLCEIERASLLDYLEPTEETFEDLRVVAQRAIAGFGELGDDRGLARARTLLAEVHWSKCHYAEMEAELERALVHADRAGDERERAAILSSLARAAFMGPLPVEAALRRCDEVAGSAAGDPAVGAVVEAMRAGLYGLRGDTHAADARFAESRELAREYGLNEVTASLPLYVGLVHILAGRGPAAEEGLRPAYEASEGMGDRSRRATIAAFLAEALYLRGRYAEAEQFATDAARDAGRDDVFPQVVWRGVQAKVEALRDSDDHAEQLAAAAVRLALDTDCLSLVGHALLDLAETLSTADRTADAIAAVERALESFRAKGDVVSVTRAEARLALLATAVGAP
jgi:class 3 adenylate cyclase/tetratricopeptide (TPR) repeat protein